MILFSFPKRLLLAFLALKVFFSPTFLAAATEDESAYDTFQSSIQYQYTFPSEGGEVEVFIPGPKKTIALNVTDDGDLLSGSLGSITFHRKRSRYVWDGIEMGLFDVYHKVHEDENMDAAHLLLVMEDYIVTYKENFLPHDVSDQSCDTTKTATSKALSVSGALLPFIAAGGVEVAPLLLAVGLASALVGIIECPHGLITEWEDMYNKVLQHYRQFNHEQTLDMFTRFSDTYNSYHPDIHSARDNQLEDLVELGKNVIHTARFAPLLGFKAAYQVGILSITIQTLLISRSAPNSDVCKTNYNLLLNTIFKELDRFYALALRKWDEDIADLKCESGCNYFDCQPCEGLQCTFAKREKAQCEHSVHKDLNTGWITNPRCTFAFSCRNDEKDRMVRLARKRVQDKMNGLRSNWLADIKPLRDEVDRLKASVQKSMRNGYKLCQSMSRNIEATE